MVTQLIKIGGLMNGCFPNFALKRKKKTFPSPGLK